MAQRTTSKREHAARDDAAVNTTIAILSTYNLRGEVRPTQRDLELLTSGKAFSLRLMDFALFSAYNHHVESLFRAPSPVCLFPSDAVITFDEAKQATSWTPPAMTTRPRDFRYIMVPIRVTSGTKRHWLLAVLVNVKGLSIVADDPMGSDEEWDPEKTPLSEPPPSILLFDSAEATANVKHVVKTLKKMTEVLVGVVDQERTRRYAESFHRVRVS